MKTATQKANAAATRADMYQEITNKFIEALQGGRIPWHKPWSGSANAARSYASGRAYSWLNQMYILIQAEQRFLEGATDKDSAKKLVEKICGGRFLTWTEIQAIEGAKVRKGSKAFTVTFFKMYQPKDSDGNPATITTHDNDGNEVEKPRLVPVLKWYRVFSEFDIENLPAEAPEAVKVLDPIAEADQVINNYVVTNSPLKLEIKNGDKAFYSPSLDLVVIPERSQYSNIAEYYSTAFHELTHSTGHKSRLDRLSTGAAAAFGGEDYSREELVAEMGSAMCLGRLQINDAAAFRNSAAYVQGWLKALRNDNKMIFWASSRAEKAVKWIFGEREERDEEPKESNQAPEAAPAAVTEPEKKEEIINISADKVCEALQTFLKEKHLYKNGESTGFWFNNKSHWIGKEEGRFYFEEDGRRIIEDSDAEKVAARAFEVLFNMPESQPKETKKTEEVNKIVSFWVTVMKAEKIGGVVTEIVQQERVYLAGSKLKHKESEAIPVTATFAEMERGYIIEQTREYIQKALDAKAPGKYVVEIDRYEAISI